MKYFVVILLSQIVLSGCAAKRPAKVQLFVPPECVQKIVLVEPCALVNGKPTNCHLKMMYACTRVKEK
jgi:hypothetical protein